MRDIKYFHKYFYICPYIKLKIMKSLTLTAFLFLSTLSFGQNLSDHLVAYYPFNGNANDATIYNHNGIVNSGTLTIDRFGKLNNAYSFSGQDNSIIIPNFFKSTQFKNNFSISFWMKQSDISDPILVISGSYFIFGIDNSATHWHHVSTKFNDISDSDHNWSSSLSLLNNTWINVVGTCDGTTAKIYFNGSLAKTHPAILYSDTSANTSVEIGNQFFTGSLDDIRIYNRVLTQSDVSALYSEPSGIETVSVPNISIYPNPSKGILHLSEPCDVKIYNLSGQLVKSCLNEQAIDVSGLKGLYMIEVRNKEGVKVEKVMVD